MQHFSQEATVSPLIRLRISFTFHFSLLFHEKQSLINKQNKLVCWSSVCKAMLCELLSVLPENYPNINKEKNDISSAPASCYRLPLSADRICVVDNYQSLRECAQELCEVHTVLYNIVLEVNVTSWIKANGRCGGNRWREATWYLNHSPVGLSVKETQNYFTTNLMFKSLTYLSSDPFSS